MRTAIGGWTTVLGLMMVLLGVSWDAQAGRVSCTTRWDKDFRVYRTRCTDGRQYKSQSDPAFDRYRTRELPQWKKVEPKGKGR
jgi:hypothetical protein